MDELDEAQDYTKEVDYIEIGKKGFLLPIIALAYSILFYALTMIITAFNNIPGYNGHPITIPGYAGIVGSFAVVVFAMTVLGYFGNFTDGAKYPKKALVYGSCAIIGLIFFWGALSGINPKSLSSDAITSAIIEIILTFSGAIISYKFFRDNYKNKIKSSSQGV